MDPDSSAAVMAAAITERSATGVAAAVNRMIRAGELSPGTRLPTVRKLAEALGTSPTTVNEAWRWLSRIGAIRTEGRNGSFVAEQPGTARPSRFWRLAGDAGRLERDLSTGVPDPELLPRLPALPGRGETPLGYLDPPVLPELETLLREAWRPLWEPEAVTVVNGSLDAVDRMLRHLVHFGDRVVVENPTFPPLLDLLEVLGATVVGVGADEDGVLPEELHRALHRRTAVVLLQPRAQNPTGTSTSTERARELAEVLRRSPDTIAVEDDHVGAIATAEQVSLARYAPERTVHVRSFSKSHGPDLRLAAVGGPTELVEQLVARRSLGPAWSSRLLQRLLATMLTDQECVAAVERARTTYAHRRAAVVEALNLRGVAATGDDGFNVWVEVPEERDSLVLLASHGIGAAPGQPFFLAPGTNTGGHVRLTTAALRTEHAPWLADSIAEATRVQGHYRHRVGR